MKIIVVGFTAAAALLSGVMFASDAKSPSSALTAAEIANRNFSARGGAQAWRAVHSLSESGRMDAGGDQRSAAPVTPGVKQPNVKDMPAAQRLKEEALLPFVIKMERPRKVRYEVQFNGKMAIQIYNGKNGWKYRPFLNRQQVEDFTPEELKIASLQSELDGPLMDYAQKGTRIELEGQEKVDGRDTFRLKLTASDNHVTHVWIDAETFLEAKIEGQPRRLDGKEHPVEVHFSDYRDVSGLKIPFVLETRVLPAAEEKGPKRIALSYSPEKIFIDTVTINPNLPSKDFEKPLLQDTEARR